LTKGAAKFGKRLDFYQKAGILFAFCSLMRTLEKILSLEKIEKQAFLLFFTRLCVSLQQKMED